MTCGSDKRSASVLAQKGSSREGRGMLREVQDCSIVETAEVISWAREVRVEVDMMG